ncbi:MAG TPA: TolC family protein, partial [Rubricoccaceae bacterium]
MFNTLALAVLVLVVMWFAFLVVALAWVCRSLSAPAQRATRVGAAGLALMAVGMPARAQTAGTPAGTLSEVVAVERALASAPALRSATAAVDLARAEQAVAGAFLTEPPVLEADAALGVGEIAAPEAYGVAVSQTLERPSVRRARQAAAGGRFAVAEAEQRVVLLGLVADVRDAVTEQAAAQDAARIAREALAAADTLVAVARLRYRYGDVSELDLRLAQADAATTAAEAFQAEAQVALAQATLVRLIALPPGSAPVVPSLVDLPVVLVREPRGDSLAPGRAPGIPTRVNATLLASRPDVAASQRTADAAALDAAFRRSARRFSTFAVRAGLERSGRIFEPDDVEGAGPFGDDFRLGRRETELTLGVAIPLPFGGGGGREVARAEAEFLLRQAEAETVVYQAAAGAGAALIRAQQAERVLSRFAAIEPELATNDELLDLASRGGEIDIPTLLAQRERLRAARRAIVSA